MTLQSAVNPSINTKLANIIKHTAVFDHGKILFILCSWVLLRDLSKLLSACLHANAQKPIKFSADVYDETKQIYSSTEFIHFFIIGFCNVTGKWQQPFLCKSVWFCVPQISVHNQNSVWQWLKLNIWMRYWLNS